MKLRNRLSNVEFEAHLTTDSSASSYAQLVLMTENGEAIDQFTGYLTELLEATEDERERLAEAGYFFA